MKFKALVDLKIGRISIRSCIDTGSTDCAMDANTLESVPILRRRVRRKTPETCVSVDGKLIKSLFSIQLPVHIADQCYHQEFKYIPDLTHPVILGTNFLESRRIVSDFEKNTAQFDNNVVLFMIPVYYVGSSIFNIHGRCDAATRKHPVN